MKRSGKERSQRQLRIGELIKQIIAQALQREHFKDPVLSGANTLSISEVQVSPDLKYATVVIYPLLPKNEKEIVEALNKETHIFNTLVARGLDTKYTPRVQFTLDTSFDAIDKINQLLKESKVSE